MPYKLEPPDDSNETKDPLSSPEHPLLPKAPLLLFISSIVKVFYYSSTFRSTMNLLSGLITFI